MTIVGVPDAVVQERIDVHPEPTVVAEAHAGDEESAIFSLEEEERAVTIGAQEVAMVAAERHDLRLLPHQTPEVLAKAAEDLAVLAVFFDHLVDGGEDLLRALARLLARHCAVDATFEYVGDTSERLLAVGLGDFDRLLGEDALEVTDDVLGELGEENFECGLHDCRDLVSLRLHPLNVAFVKHTTLGELGDGLVASLSCRVLHDPE